MINKDELLFDRAELSDDLNNEVSAEIMIEM